MGEGRAEQSHDGESGEISPGRQGRRSLEDDRERHDQEAPEHELPGGQGEQRQRRPPPAAPEHRRDRHRRGRAGGGGHSDRVERGRRTEHEGRHACDPDDARGQSRPRGREPEDGPAEQQDEDRPDCTHRRRNPTGQALGGDEEQHEEEPDVQAREHGDAEPPAGRRQASRQSDQEETGRERASSGGEQRPAGGKQLGHDPVVRAPEQRGERGLQRGDDAYLVRHRISIARRRTTSSIRR